MGAVPAVPLGDMVGDLRSVPGVPGLDVPVARGLRSKATPVETIRKSSRHAGEEATPILDRAVRLTADKNAASPKPSPAPKKTPKGTSSDPIFAILQDLPDAHLLQVAADSCVVFPASQGSPAEALSLIRANELAQAALAASRSRLEQELQLQKDKESAVAAGQRPEGGSSAVQGADGADPEGGAVSRDPRALSPSPPKASLRRRSKSVVPQGRRPVTRLARAQGMVI